MTNIIWTVERGSGPLVATAIHAGSKLSKEIADYSALDVNQRLREEDPFTDVFTKTAPSRVLVTTSRFEVDLNRPREKAVYRSPEDAWGLDLWKRELPADLIAASLEAYDDFYRGMENLFVEMRDIYGRFVVYDLHSYNHRRQGPNGPTADPEANPMVNVGTGTMADRQRFAPVIDAFINALGAADFPTGPLDVRENVKFRGGNFAKWTHSQFPRNACVLSVEFKKFFMDEWTGEAKPGMLGAIRKALDVTVSPVLDAFGNISK